MQAMPTKDGQSIIGKLRNAVLGVHDGANSESANKEPQVKHGILGGALVDTEHEFQLHNESTKGICEQQAKDALSYPDTHGELA